MENNNMGLLGYYGAGRRESASRPVRRFKLVGFSDDRSLAILSWGGQRFRVPYALGEFYSGETVACLVDEVNRPLYVIGTR